MNSSLPQGISVVIPNYNGSALLPVIIPHLLEALSTARLPFEIILSDDASTDNSVQLIKATFPQVEILESLKNRGFSPAVNRGIDRSGYSMLLLLNTDVILPPDFFKPLLRYFERDNTFGVMSRIIGWDSDTIQDGGKYPFFQGTKLKTSGNYIPKEDNTGNWLPSLYLSGANALMDTAKLKQLGGLDELFAPYYVEDTELSLRAWRMGWCCYYAHEIYCRHKESVTIKNMAKKRHIKRIYNRNKMQLHAIHLPAGRAFLWHMQLLFEALASLFILRRYFLQACGDYIGRFARIQQRRRMLRQLAAEGGVKLRSLPDVVKDILSHLGSDAVIRIR